MLCVPQRTPTLRSICHVTENLVQDRDHLLDLDLREGQRRHEAQRVWLRRIEQQPGLERLRRYLGSHWFAKRAGLQQAAAPHLAKSVPISKILKRSREPLSFLSDATEKILLRRPA